MVGYDICLKYLAGKYIDWMSLFYSILEDGKQPLSISKS